MKRLTTLSIALVAAGASIGLAATPAHAGVPNPAQHAAITRSEPSQDSVVFAQNDAATGNTVYAYQRAVDGSLQQVGAFATGGRGGALAGSVVDHLASEGSLVYDASAHLVYAVNAGSNTVTVFGVSGDRLIRRQIIASGGQFPVSIAVHDGRVFVLNARDGGTITGFIQFGGHLFPVPAWTRTLGLNPLQTPEFTSTPAQISFTPDGSKLVVTTKNGANTVDVFPVGLLGPSVRPMVNSLPGTVPFGFGFDSAGHLVLSEAGPNSVASFAIRGDGELTQLSSVATGQAATCWVVTRGDFSYVSNAGSGTVSIYRSDAGGALTSLGAVAADGGTVDAAVSGDDSTLYVQNGLHGVLDSFRIAPNGSLDKTASVTVPDAIGGEGVAAP